MALSGGDGSSTHDVVEMAVGGSPWGGNKCQIVTVEDIN